jgi:hypothetical protein
MLVEEGVTAKETSDAVATLNAAWNEGKARDLDEVINYNQLINMYPCSQVRSVLHEGFHSALTCLFPYECMWLRCLLREERSAARACLPLTQRVLLCCSKETRAQVPGQ